MNGGEGKVKQNDVAAFLDACESASNAFQNVPRNVANADGFFGPAVDALLLTRLVMLRKYKLGGASARDWLRVQISANIMTSDSVANMYGACLTLSADARRALRSRLRESDADVCDLALVDEAQSLNVHYHWNSEASAAVARPLGRFFLKRIGVRQVVVAGTHMSIVSFEAFSSGVGMHRAEPPQFDFLAVASDDNSSDDVAAAGASDVNSFITTRAGGVRVVRNGACALLQHWLELPDEVTLHLARVLQGRPRFVAGFVASVYAGLHASPLADDESIVPRALKTLEDVITRECVPALATHQRSLLSSWKRVYEHSRRVETANPSISVHTDAFFSDLVVQWAMTYAQLGQSAFVLTDAQLDCVASGCAMVAQGTEMLFAEPLVFIALLNFCRGQAIDVAAPLVKSFQNDMLSSNPVAAGRLLERIIAVRLLYTPAAFNDLLDRSMVPRVPTQYRGIVIGLRLDSHLVNLSAFTNDVSPYIILPENNAGPDVLASPFVIGCKVTADDGLKPAVVAKNKRTTHLMRLYRKAGGEASIGADYGKKNNGEPHVYQALHDMVATAARAIPSVVRVRAEWTGRVSALSSTSTSTPALLAVPAPKQGDKWDDDDAIEHGAARDRDWLLHLDRALLERFVLNNVKI
jgi:hypothetical protein